VTSHVRESNLLGQAPRRTAVWKYDADTHQKHVQEDKIWWGKEGKAKMPRMKVFLDQVRDVVPRSVLRYEDCGSTQEARTELLAMIEGATFTTPKPVRLIKRLIQIATDKDSLILDSFAGSGTTGHAALSVNKDGDGNRRFILVEMETDICRKVTAQRLKKAITGYRAQGTNGNGKIIGLGGGFKYCRLANPLFDESGTISKEVTFAELAAHLYFTETGQPLPDADKVGHSPLLGLHNGVGIFLLFNGILGDKKVKGGNVLTGPILASLPSHDGPKIIYGESNRLGTERMRREGITFKQIPYRIRVG